LKAKFCKIGARILLLAIGLNLWLPLRAEVTPAAQAALSNNDSTNAARDLKPGPDAGKIAFWTANLLENYQYLRHQFDATISSRMFDAYLTSLDPQHMHFLQSDLADFASFRTNLGKRMLPSFRREADTTPAYDIFSRYRERLKQHVDYVDELLKTEKFDFTSDERILWNRHDQPYPKTLDEAKQVWRERLRYEYLSEKISRETRKTNANLALGTNDNSRFVPTNDNPTFVVHSLTTTNSDGSVVTVPVEKPSQPKTMHEEIVETLGKSYHRQLRVFSEYESSDVLNVFLEALARSYDPHSDYEGPMDYEDFAMQMNLSLFGIGAVLQQKDDYVTIEELMNGPAKLSKKIKVGDRIVAVAQSNKPPQDIFGMPINKAVRLIRGPKGTEVRLTIVPLGASDSDRQVVSLVRDEIKLESGEAKGKILEVPDTSGNNVRLGIIDLPSFYATIDSQGTTPKSTTADVKKLLKKFREQKVAGVVLDLRHNGGGSLEEAIRLAGLFIKEGPVVQIKHWDGEIEVREDTDPSIDYAGPLILLTSRFSASASEIVAGALQDYGRALIVGDTSTFGKGTAQQLFSLSKIPPLGELAAAGPGHDPGTLKLTNSKFYRASGASTELRGVAADIVLPSLWNDSTEVGEITLDNHMPWDTIKSSTYEKVNMVQGDLGELAKRSAARVATNAEFAYLREDIARVQKERADKTVSVNEKQQLKDRDELIAQHKLREQEREKHKVAAPTEYDLTVAEASQAGLPKAHAATNDESSANSDSLIPVRPNDGDELAEAVGSEAEHAEAARLNEAKNILMDYIRMSKEGPAKQNAPLLAQ
jgi:carboxyl-terminal processing protease